MSLFKQDNLSEKLTTVPIDTLVRQSFSGMAHFAGTGPNGRTCRECIFFNHGPYDYRAKNGKYRGEILPADCKKYQQITQCKGDAVPDVAAACKYFDENPAIPERFAK